MAIVVTCARCGSSFGAPEESVGKRGKCPKCQGLIDIPQAATANSPARATAPAAAASAPAAKATAPRAPDPSASTAPVLPPKRPPAAVPEDAATAALRTARENPAELQRRILGGFRAAIEPIELSLGYRFGIFLVLVLMVLLPLIYVGLIVLACYGVYYHAVHDVGILQAAGAGRSGFYALLVYLAPIVAGGILVLFMVKPLFARPSVDTRIRSLTPQSDPLLFAFVARVCEAVGAPAPRRIDADFQVNASASFRRGMLSMLGNDLVLTIGLPLAAGLDLRQFAGVLAHEFGHFTQGAGMRLTYFIRAISMWFTRVVYQRDQWDERLDAWARGLDIRVSFILHLARLCVWITRRILWVLMVVGHAVSGFMLRQMELDADRHQVRLVGSDAFEPTFRKITLLDVATEGAHMDLGEWYKEGRLGDNLPRLIVANLEQIPEELVDKILAGEARRKTGWFDSHPASKDRLANALREAAPGVFHLEIPAAALFSDFEGLCRNVTWDFYRGVFGPQFQPSDMHPVADLLSRQGRQVAAVKALARYFQGQFNVLRPITLPPEAADPPENAAQASEQMKAARAKMLALTADYEKALEDYDKSDTLAIECLQAAAAAQAKVTVPAGTFSRPLGTPAALRRGQDVVFAEQKRLKPQLRAFEQAAEERLAAALRLLAVPQVAARVADAPRRREEVVRLLPAVRALARHLSGILGVRDTRAVLSILLASIQGNQQSVSLFGALDRNGSDLHTRLTRLRHELQCEPYPFDHAKGELSIAQYALADEPRSDDLGANYQGAEEMLDKLATLYRRAMAELANVAEQVESAFGLEPLPEVEKTQIGTEP